MTPPPHLFALGFANLALLWGTLAASLPIIIHLLNRRKFREVRWAAMRFLLAAIRKNQRRVRMEQWLLLAVRTLIVLLVAMAMAKPFLEAAGLPLMAGQRTHTVLVLDGSLSMGYAPADATRFDQAKAIAKQMVKDAPRGDAISVILMGAPPKVVVGDPSYNHDEVSREVEALALPHGGTDLAASLEAIVRVLDASDIRQKQVVFLTDMQAASWRPRPEAEGGLKIPLAKIIEKKARSVLIDLGKDGGENRGVTSMALNTPVAIAGSPFVAQGTIRNFGAAPAADVHARLLVDGQFVNEQVLDSIPAGEEVAVAFTQSLGTAGEHIVEIQIDQDPLRLDDARRLSVPTRERVEVLIVDGDPRPEPFESESDYLVEALNPQTAGGGGASPALIRPEVISEARLAGADLTRFDTVVLCNIAQVTDAEVGLLDAYLKQGGGLVVFGGEQVVADNFNRLFYKEGKGLLPGGIAEIVGDAKQRTSSFGFDLLGLKHPIVAQFSGAPEAVVAGLTGVKTWSYQKLKRPEDSTATVALGFDSGDPAILESAHGRGRVIQVATTADAAWTTWPLHPSYPPVMEQIVLRAAAGRLTERNVVVGQPLTRAFPAVAAGAAATVVRPDDEEQGTKLATEPDVSVLAYENTDLSGRYLVKVGPPVASEILFAANPDPAESELTRIDEAGLREVLPGWPIAVVKNSPSVHKDPMTVGQQGELHRPFLWAVLGLMVFESLLAWKFGHHA